MDGMINTLQSSVDTFDMMSDICIKNVELFKIYIVIISLSFLNWPCYC